MCRSLAVAVFTFVLPLLGFAQSPKVGIFLAFDSQPGNLALDTMKTEVAKILKPSGVALRWRLLSDNRGTESFADLVVMRFKGRCQVQSFPAVGSDFGSLGETVRLGYTAVSEGHVLPFSEVECDQVMKCLPYLGTGISTRQKQTALGLAMGRVVAHELYHVLAGTTRHAAEGLARASQSWMELISGALVFQDKDSKAIRESVEGSRAVLSFTK